MLEGWPWWGYLILSSVALVCLTWLGIAVMAVMTGVRARRDFDTHWKRTEKRLGNRW